MRDKMIPGRIDHERYKQITLQSDYDRNGSLIIAYDDQGDIYIQTDGYVRLANTSSSFVGNNLKEHLRDLVNESLSDVKIGTEVEYRGKIYVCKPALPDDQKQDPDDECDGCALKGCKGIDSPCLKYLCIDDERSDHNNIRFVEKGGDQ
ncbi:MAG: hypothetical protein K6E94_00585 [Elusimicrobiaceae bacterium]|nr:hypothetical protein [Elusimicrobiaceae bacterium]